MTSSPASEHWAAVYRDKLSTDVSWFQDEPVVSLKLIEAAVHHSSASIVDVGGGASMLVDRLLARNFTALTVLDISENALDVASSRLGSTASDVTWIVTDLLEWEPPQEFDVWHDRAVLHFLTEPDAQTRYSEVVKRTVMPGGHAIIGTFATDGPTHCSGLEVAQHDQTSISALFGSAFELVDFLAEDHTTPTGAVQRFSWFVMRRNGGTD